MSAKHITAKTAFLILVRTSSALSSSRFVLLVAFSCVSLNWHVAPASGDLIIASNSPTGTGAIGNSWFPGQSVTTPNDGIAYDNVTFNWFDNSPNPNPYASGEIFLLSQAYAGTPSGLSSSTPGFIASASASGNQFAFIATVPLSPNTQYFFYQDENKGASLLRRTGPNYPGGIKYGASSAGSAYVGFPSPTFPGADEDWAFTLKGSAVPEPNSFAIFGIAMLGMARRRRQR